VSQLTCQLAENHVTLCQFKKISASWQRFYEALPIFAIGKKSLAERGFRRKAFYRVDDIICLEYERERKNDHCGRHVYNDVVIVLDEKKKFSFVILFTFVHVDHSS